MQSLNLQHTLAAAAAVSLLALACNFSAYLNPSGGEPPPALPAATASATAPSAPAASLTPAASPTPRLQRLLPPPAGSLYHGVYPGGTSGAEDDLPLADLLSYEKLVGKQAAWVYFSHNWYNGPAFPLAAAEWVRKAGSVPFIRLMMWNRDRRNQADPATSPGSILAGEFDAALQAWCRAAAGFGTPILAEYGTEVNGEWFPWNGKWNGAGKTDGYGDPAVPDGPERFRDAYRHIIGICRSAGAANAAWVFHANYNDNPHEAWNRLENYYPGDEWIDWIGVSVYGEQTPMGEKEDDFRTQMDAVYPRLAALSASKPILLAEFAVTDHNPHVVQAAWADAALNDILNGRWPRLAGFSWWNEAWQNDNNPAHDTSMRVQDNPALAALMWTWIHTRENVLGRPLVQ